MSANDPSKPIPIGQKMSPHSWWRFDSRQHEGVFTQSKPASGPTFRRNYDPDGHSGGNSPTGSPPASYYLSRSLPESKSNEGLPPSPTVDWNRWTPVNYLSPLDYLTMPD